ncbi:YqgE/AlgH family protein [Algoriphagus sediminis]|uniref:YqgE/AlgH family protein n=1 Tax=Algoriphagus sediminis TaxID=3057113 RepID=A0ABT7YCY0_9BACT|nr:YqgE/AlgH family protein [Algoriphagus sediminis]MDN3204382.1 YqgE/AlgH family protein [Algoriphagus sediminis]
MDKRTEQIPTAGDLLISEPFLQDQNFMRSVILLCDHNEEGSFGFVMNKPSILRLGEIVQDLDFLDKEVFVGGPVEQNTLHFVYLGDKQLEGSISVGNQIWWGGDFDQLVEKLKLNQMELDRIRFFIGYSGWGAGQLQDEMNEETWILCREDIDEDSFDSTPEDLWKGLLKNMGGEFKLIANYPRDPRLN